MRRSALVVLLVLLVLPVAARAAERRVGVFPMHREGPFERYSVGALEVLFAVELGKQRGYVAFSAREFPALGSEETAARATSCAELRCSAELGRSLGLDEVVALELVDLGDTLVLSAVLIDVARAAPVVRATRVVQFPEELGELARTLTRELVSRSRSPAVRDALRRPRVAVLPTTTNPADPAIAAAVAAMIAGEFGADDATEVLSGADVTALLAESGRSAEACAEATASCMAEIGGALGAQRVVTSEVSRAGGEWVVGLSLVELRRAEALHRSVKRVSNPGNLPDAVRAALREVGRQAGLADAPLVPAFAGTIVAPSDRRDGAAWAILGLGAASLLAGGLLEATAIVDEASASDAAHESSVAERAGDSSRANERRTRGNELRYGAMVDEGRALGFGLVGLTAVGWGVVYLLTDDPPPQP